MQKGEFRFGYHTDKFDETCLFYTKQLRLPQITSWEQSEHDKGAFFDAGTGIIAVLHQPKNGDDVNPALDGRKPAGAFMAIQVWDIEQRFEDYQARGVIFKQKLTTQPWGHRSFSVIDPNGVVLFMFQEME